MISFGKFENQSTVLSISLLVILLVGYVDYISGSELGFSFFYLVPIVLISLQRSTKMVSILIFTLLSSSLWFTAEFLTRDYSSIFFPIWNASIRFLIFTSIGILLHYMKEKDRELNQMNLKLTQSNEEKNRFIGIAAHDLRSPLSGIYSLSELARDLYQQEMNGDLSQIVNMIHNTSSNSLKIVEDLLDVSKIEAGKLDIHPQKQDYIQFVKRSVAMNQIIGKPKEIEILLRTELNAVEVEFDEKYFSEVLNNLFSNAIKYSHRKTQVLVSIFKTKDGMVRTEVKDQGIGIPQHEQKLLFNYFQKTSSQPTEGEKSTGLGLAITKQIILLHKGSIGVESELKKGATFYFCIPVNQ